MFRYEKIGLITLSKRRTSLRQGTNTGKKYIRGVQVGQKVLIKFVTLASQAFNFFTKNINRMCFSGRAFFKLSDSFKIISSILRYQQLSFGYLFHLNCPVISAVIDLTREKEENKNC